MAEKAKIIAALLVGYGLTLVLQLLLNLVTPIPAALKEQPKLTEQLLEQDVSAEQWANSAERLTEKLKLSRLLKRMHSVVILLSVPPNFGHSGDKFTVCRPLLKAFPA